MAICLLEEHDARIQNELPRGLIVKMVNVHSALKDLATVLARWVHYFLGETVSIEPAQKVDGPAWRWHMGLVYGTGC
jgi:hypothetical protein